MLVSKSNEFNTSSFIDSGNCNERKSSESMELLAYSIINLICKEAASGTYRGALETLQKMMSECIYHEGGNGSNLLIVFYVQIMPDDFVMQL
uniref:YpjCB family protein n=1 Tax=Shigella sonnei TaxID=624 RepID=UPI000AB51ED0